MAFRMGVNAGDLRIHSWNCNSLMKTHSSWVKFISKLKNSSENIFVLIDTRFGPKQEKILKKCGMGLSFSTLSIATKGDLWYCLGMPFQLKT